MMSAKPCPNTSVTHPPQTSAPNCSESSWKSPVVTCVSVTSYRLRSALWVTLVIIDNLRSGWSAVGRPWAHTHRSRPEFYFIFQDTPSYSWNLFTDTLGSADASRRDSDIQRCFQWRTANKQHITARRRRGPWAIRWRPRLPMTVCQSKQAE